MKSVSIGITILLLTILKINCQDNISRKILSPRDLGYYRCQKSKSHVQLCFCGKNKVVFNPLTGNKCVDGQIVRKSNQNRYGLVRKSRDHFFDYFEKPLS